jgi:hypothetical protein
LDGASPHRNANPNPVLPSKRRATFPYGPKPTKFPEISLLTFLRFETAMNEPQAYPPSTPPTFVIGASSFFRHLTFVIRHSQTETC